MVYISAYILHMICANFVSPWPGKTMTKETAARDLDHLHAAKANWVQTAELAEDRGEEHEDRG